MDQALFLRCGISQILPQPSFITRSKIISARKLTNSRDLIFFRSKNTTTTPLISSLSQCFSTILTVGHPQRINARRLISTTTLVRAGDSPTAAPSSSDANKGPPSSPLSPLEPLKGFLHGILYLTSSTNEAKSKLHTMSYNEDVLKQKQAIFDNIKSGKTTVQKALKELSCPPVGSLEEYDAGLVSVEILIYVGRYGKALNLLDDLKNITPPDGSDIRPLLFKAIIYTVMKDKREMPNDPWDDLQF